MRSFELTDIGTVVIKKSALAKRMILKIDHAGSPVVVIPKSVPYKAGELFAKSQKQWIIEHANLHKRPVLLDGDTIGDNHTLSVITADVALPTVRVQNNLIRVKVPRNVDIKSPEIQQKITRAVVRALKSEAETTLPVMLYALAKRYGYNYATVSTRDMKSRWGSCSSKREITLNIWLMQVPVHLREYVLCHELAHLHHPHHKQSFWTEVSSMVPDYKKYRTELQAYKPFLT